MRPGFAASLRARVGARLSRLRRAPSVEIVRWRPRQGTNFGDELGPVIAELALQRRGLRLDSPARRNRRLLTVGSILHSARSGDVVWGAGVNGKHLSHRFRATTLDVRAVRGPLTKGFLEEREIACPEVFGDPASLLPHLLPKLASCVNVGHEVVLLPHYRDDPLLPTTLESGIERVSTALHWLDIVLRLLAARKVVTSSLHGLIIAEAFGKDVALLRLSETEPIYKYEDYLLGTGRSSYVVATSLNEALSIAPLPQPVIAAEHMLRAFPYDLWAEDHAQG
jgi:pyruvyltransferase